MRTEEAVDFFGDRITLARCIGVSASAVTQWGEFVPVSRVKSIRMAMRERADHLEQQARLLRQKAKEA